MSLLFPTALSFGRHLFGGSAHGLEDHQFCPCLLCKEQKGVRLKPSKKIDQNKSGSEGSPRQGRTRSRKTLTSRANSKRAVFFSSAVGSLRAFRTSLPSFQLGTFPQPDSQRTKRKSYFEYFTFGFFSMAVIKPGLLLKQYHPKSPVSLGALWTHNLRRRQLILVQNLFDYQVKREPKTIVETRAVDRYTFYGRLVHGRIRLGDYEGIPRRQEAGALGNSGPFATISEIDPTVERPIFLRTDLLGVEDEELVDAPSEDELLNDPSEEGKEVPLEEELVLGRTGVTLSALGQQLIWGSDAGGRLCLGHSSYLEVIHKVSYSDLPRTMREYWAQKEATRSGSFWVPYVDSLEEHPQPFGHHKGRKARELRVAALRWGADQSFRNVPTG
ncbi:hypothetical protein Cgig2_029806 [Carnegiea gigantea]|uniref:Uncharacterized protein n=1 Tax=Carnegiea gigantea TaxID=171969 RepID=A0A9Q1KJT4_9CARY|nr:hypothetical protein Cgig2_029806 [Carnegiea gigantea]